MAKAQIKRKWLGQQTYSSNWMYFLFVTLTYSIPQGEMTHKCLLSKLIANPFEKTILCHYVSSWCCVQPHEVGIRDRLSMKQLNQIWQHHTTALVIQTQHIFSIFAIINPLLDTGLPMSYIFRSNWLVCTPAVLDYLPGSVSL